MSEKRSNNTQNCNLFLSNRVKTWDLRWMLILRCKNGQKTIYKKLEISIEEQKNTKVLFF